MKKILILVMLAVMLAGCSKNEGGSDGIASYELSNITQGYESHAAITGTLTNTGSITMSEIMILAIVTDGERTNTLVGTTDKATLQSGESTEFYISTTIGVAYTYEAESVEYRVIYD